MPRVITASIDSARRFAGKPTKRFRAFNIPRGDLGQDASTRCQLTMIAGACRSRLEGRQTVRTHRVLRRPRLDLCRFS